jgi:2-keto-4-pentenoate hydratase/2-oxohepta-3-ene-1,7-dioic acid hydratase in catechol pathway
MQHTINHQPIMRIVRHLGAEGPQFAALQDDGSALEIIGDVFGSFVVSDRIVPLGKILAPVNPPNILCIGVNYREHAAEGKSAIPRHPVLFMKNTPSLQNPEDPIIIPIVSSKVDYEGELAVVIGRSCKNVSDADALDYVLGYTCANDVSARDWQKDFGGGQFCQGKSFDTFCPIGPTIVTKEDIPDPNNLRIQTLLNGEIMQDGHTRDMIFNVPHLISFLSQGKTLLPGTIILTGTPHGVGFARTPPVWLKEGDNVSIVIENIGTLTNPVGIE